MGFYARGLASGVARLTAGTVALVAIAAGVWLQAAQDPQQPVFRGGVDVIEFDVSVLDRDRRPIRGLTAADFTVTEDGRAQRVVAVSHVDVESVDPARSARMRFASRDVSVNDLGDEIGDGRLVAIIFDDVNLPAEDPDIIRATRETARYIVDQLGPSDMAAIVFSQQAGRTQDFTSDRARLLEAIDRFQPVVLGWVEPTPQGMGPGGGDMIQRWSPTLARSTCMRNEPVIPTIDAVTSRMATAPGRRKAVMLLTVGVPLSFNSTQGCAAQLNDAMRNVFRKAQRANMNFYTIDPAGYGGYQEYLRTSAGKRGVDIQRAIRPVPTNTRLMQDFMRILAENTGGRAVINTDAIESTVDQILSEDRSYYLIGYESSNGAPDGKFRKVDIKVNRPGASVRTRPGYWAARPEELAARASADGVTTHEASLSGLLVSQGVPVRASLVPIGPTAGGSARDVDVAMLLSVRFPTVRTLTKDTLTIVRNVYDVEGRPGPPVRTSHAFDLAPGTGTIARHDIVEQMSLPPGRYEVRFNVQSKVLNATGTVYADLEVPDFQRSPLSLSGLVLGSPVDGGRRSDLLEGRLPLVPTSARDFAAAEPVAAFVRVYQGGTTPIVPVTVLTEVWSAADEAEFAATNVLEPGAFDASRGANHHVSLPLGGLSPGPHLVSISARLPGGRTARRDLILRIR